MYSIETSIEIAAPLATVRNAISTREGFRAWLAADTRLDAAGRYVWSFGERSVTLTLDRADDRGIAMTCVEEQNNPDWRGTALTITLTALAGDRTRVELVQAGYRAKDECYERTTGAWPYFMMSLAAYATTGRGTPFEAKVTAPAAAAVAS